MSLILCRNEPVKQPLYIEKLGVHIYSSQELCYVIYQYPLLALNGFVDENLVEFIAVQLDMGFLAVKMEKWMKGGGRRGGSASSDSPGVRLLQRRGDQQV